MKRPAQILQSLTDQLNKIDKLDLTRQTAPAGQRVSDSAEELFKGYDARTRAATGGREPAELDVGFVDPAVDPYRASYAENGVNPATGGYTININPNTDEAFFAHELGHLTSRQTDMGGAVRDLRSAIGNNPQLRNALMAAAVLAPAGAAIAEEGDNDLDASLAVAAATQLPTLIDEGLATRQGLAIMDNADRRARLGQRAKLAGGYLSYLAPAVAAAIGGNAIGNMLD